MLRTIKETCKNELKCQTLLGDQATLENIEMKEINEEEQKYYIEICTEREYMLQEETLHLE